LLLEIGQSGISGAANTSAVLQVLNAKDSNGATPLHHACYKGHLDCVKFLVESGVFMLLSLLFFYSGCMRETDQSIVLWCGVL
jgi:ankyrin repeat protein